MNFHLLTLDLCHSVIFDRINRCFDVQLKVFNWNSWFDILSFKSIIKAPVVLFAIMARPFFFVQLCWFILRYYLAVLGDWNILQNWSFQLFYAIFAPIVLLLVGEVFLDYAIYREESFSAVCETACINVDLVWCGAEWDATRMSPIRRLFLRRYLWRPIWNLKLTDLNHRSWITLPQSSIRFVIFSIHLFSDLAFLFWLIICEICQLRILFVGLIFDEWGSIKRHLVLMVLNRWLLFIDIVKTVALRIWNSCIGFINILKVLLHCRSF